VIHFIACAIAILGLHPCKSEYQKIYAQTNRTYFNNQLPKHPRFLVHQLGKTADDLDVVALTFIDNHNNVNIWLWPNEIKDLRSTMIHEQCHIVTWDEPEEHGQRWSACMKERGLRGAREGQ
jgi:hypothetical protein